MLDASSWPTSGREICLREAQFFMYHLAFYSSTESLQPALISLSW